MSHLVERFLLNLLPLYVKIFLEVCNGPKEKINILQIQQTLIMNILILQIKMQTLQSLSGKMCHELNNPLTLISSTIQLMEDKHPEVGI